MWQSFQRLRTSKTFRCDWSSFIETATHQQAASHPAFWQNITMAIFKKLIELQFPIPPEDGSEHPDRPLTFEEKNALRYVAGYVCRKIRTNLEKSSLEGKDEMIFCVMSFAGDEDDDSCTEVWMDAVDRGGLWHQNDATFMFFMVTEKVARRFFTTNKLEWFHTESNPTQKVTHHIQS